MRRSPRAIFSQVATHKEIHRLALKLHRPATGEGEYFIIVRGQWYRRSVALLDPQPTIAGIGELSDHSQNIAVVVQNQSVGDFDIGRRAT